MSDQYFAAFVAAWMALGIGGMFVLARLRNPTTKRRSHRLFTIVAALLFLAFVWFAGSTRDLVFVGPAVLLVGVLNSWLVRVCDSCAAFTYPRYLVQPSFCSKCGARLTRRSDSGKTKVSAG